MLYIKWLLRIYDIRFSIYALHQVQGAPEKPKCVKMREIKELRRRRRNKAGQGGWKIERL